MGKIDFERLICDFMGELCFYENGRKVCAALNDALKCQGFERIDGEIVSIKDEEPKFNVGDKIRRKTPRRYDKDMQVARVESNYYLCNHIGKFSSEPISFSEESNYELVEQDSTVGKEDEILLKMMFVFKTRVFPSSEECESFIDFLKLLKDRYTWGSRDLPHWKKSTLPNNNNAIGFNSEFFSYNGYFINYKELFEKLPKEK